MTEVDRSRKTGGSMGNIYFVGKHWVALVPIPAKRSAMYYADALAIVVSDVDLAADKLSTIHRK